MLSIFIYVFSIPSFGESSSITRYIIYLSIVVLGCLSFLYCLLYSDFKIKIAHLLIPAFVVLSFVGTAIYSHEFKAYRTLVLLMLSFFIFYFSFKCIRNKTIVILIISLALFLFSLFFILHYRHEIIDFRSYTNSDFRLGSYFDNPNAIGVYSLIGISTSLYLILFYKNKCRFFLFLPLGTMLLVGLTTGSKSFLISLLFIVLIFLFFKLKNHKLVFLLVVIGVIGLSVLLLSLPFMSTIRDRLVKAFGTLFGGGTKMDPSTVERFLWMDYGFYLGSKNLIFGYGSKGFATFSGVGTYAHSNFSEVLCDFGVIGFLLFYAPLVVLLFKCLTNKKIDNVFVISFILFYFIAGFSSVYYYKKIYYLILALLYYLVYVDGGEPKSISIVSSIKHILFTCDSMGSGGAEKVISTLSNEMANRGIRVSIVGVGDRKEPRTFHALNQGVEYITLYDKTTRKKHGRLSRLIKLRKCILNLNPDVVISFLPNAIVYTMICIFGTGKPFIVSERNDPNKNPNNKIYRYMKELGFRYADGAVFQTADAMRYYPESVQKKSAIIYNPVQLMNVPKNKVKVRNKVVLAVGRLTEQKNYKMLLESFSKFNQMNKNEYILRIYGNGPLHDELIEYCSKLKIDSFVQFVGNDANWHKKESCDAMYILTSNFEGMSNSLAEALALGIPSISTDCPIGGSKELIEDGINGYLVPVNDVDTLVKTMNKVVIDSSILSDNSLREDLSPKIIADKWLFFIQNLKREVSE